MKTHFCLSAILVVGLCSVGESVIRYVDAAAPGGTGLSWATAHKTLQAAATASSPGDEVWVAKGVYNHTNATPIIWAPSIEVYGGFFGNETLRAQRNANINATIVGGTGLAAFRMNTPTSTPNVVDGFRFNNNKTDDGCIRMVNGVNIITNNKFFANEGIDSGCVITAAGGHVTFAHNYVLLNKISVPKQTLANEGVIRLLSANSRIESNAFIENATFHFLLPGVPVIGDIRADGGSHVVVNNTFLKTISYGPGFDGFHVFRGFGANVAFNNNIVRDVAFPATAKVKLTGGGTYSGNNNIWPLNSTAPVSGGVPHASDLYLNTTFVSGGYDYHIDSSSPAYNTGDTSKSVLLTDVDGLPRIDAGIVDRGADERNFKKQFVVDGFWPAQPPIFPAAGISPELQIVHMGTGVVAYTLPLPPIPGGGFAISVPLDEGVYDFIFRAPLHTADAIRMVIVDGESNLRGLEFDPKAGDANADNSIDLLDYFALSDAYNSVPGTTVWNPNADFNFDGSVDLLDYFVLSDNYNTTGAEIEIYP
jgi:hypothetical protein